MGSFPNILLPRDHGDKRCRGDPIRLVHYIRSSSVGRVIYIVPLSRRLHAVIVTDSRGLYCINSFVKLFNSPRSLFAKALEEQ